MKGPTLRLVKPGERGSGIDWFGEEQPAPAVTVEDAVRLVRRPVPRAPLGPAWSPEVRVVPPPSPHGLVQERCWSDPWRVLVVCVLCNVTRGRLAWPVAQALWRRWPTAGLMATADRTEVQAIVRCLGLQRVRSGRLLRLSRAWARGVRDPRELPGCGRYAREAWSLFVLGVVPAVVRDRELARYAAWRREGVGPVLPG